MLQVAKAEEIKDKERYQRLVGRLIYLSHTFSDIAYVISMVNQLMHALGPTHFEVVYGILRYLKRTLVGVCTPDILERSSDFPDSSHKKDSSNHFQV